MGGMSRNALLSAAMRLHQAGQFPGAEELYRQLLGMRSDDPPVLHYLSGLLIQTGRREEGIALIDRLIELIGDDPDVLNNRGAAQASLGRSEAALASFARALASRRDFPDALNNQALSFLALGRNAEALAALDRSLRLAPQFPEAHHNRGLALWKLKRPREALGSFDRALTLRPNFPECMTNRGAVLSDLGRYKEALEWFDRALVLRPDDPAALNQRGVALWQLGRDTEAIACFDRSLAQRSDQPEIHCNRAMARHFFGDIAGAWEDYEWRTKVHGSREFDVPAWRGDQDLTGKTVVLYGEQGFGDSLQFCRYVPCVKSKGARVVVDVRRSLVEIMRSLSGVDEVVETGTPLPSFDFQCSLMSLPHVLGERQAYFSPASPYLSANQDRVASWQARLPDSSKLRVGVVWHSGVHRAQPDLLTSNARRDVAFEEFARLNRTDIQFVSLQKGVEAEAELARHGQRLWRGKPPISFSRDIDDFADTAALIMTLDLVITVDTSVAHLAGALGKPVWVMLHCHACWRWLRDRSDSPWYPTARLFRQQRPGDWRSVIDEVRQALDSHVREAAKRA